MLAAQCFATRGLPKAKDTHHIIGVASEKEIDEPGSWDVAYFFLPEWTEEMNQCAEELKEEFGLMKSPLVRQTRESEYPK